MSRTLAHKNAFRSWGQIMHEGPECYPQFTDEVTHIIRERRESSVLGVGMGRSYGDVCTSRRNQLIGTRHLARILSVDDLQATISVEPGVRIGDLVRFSRARGMQVPVVPGTAHVTVGGAIANDIHGKDSFTRGSFGNWVKGISILRSDGSVHFVKQGDALFAATIGGLGLTGFILSAELQLLKKPTTHYDVMRKPFRSLDELFKLWSDYNGDSNMGVAWIDAALRAGHGVLSFAVAAKDAGKAEANTTFHYSMSAHPAPLSLVNQGSIFALNAFLHLKNKFAPSKSVVFYDQFHFPLDRVDDWNRFYGRAGPVQYQFVVPDDQAHVAFSEVFRILGNSAPVCTLAVAKRFGSVPALGRLSFSRRGHSLALDFANGGPAVLNLMQKLDEVVMRNGGGLYAAKDCRMASDVFKQSHPQLSAFLPFKDEAFHSDLWARVTNEIN